jgi:hypothetical protein
VLGLDFALWVPATMAPELLAGSRELESRDIRGYGVMGLLRRGVTHAQAEGELNVAMGELAGQFPATNANLRGEVLSFRSAARGPQRMITGALAALQGS